MSERIDTPGRCIDLARRIASGELSEDDGAMAILRFAHEQADLARDAMADALTGRRRDAAA
jgi:hypothetical protein